MKCLNVEILGISFAVIIALTFAGCGRQTSENETTQVAEASHADHDHADHEEANHQDASTAVDDHSGWWCVAHAIPEEVCSLCSAKAAKEFKANGDWCDEHNRAESQCFVCDPSRAEPFAKLYEAKYGKEPPKAWDEIGL